MPDRPTSAPGEWLDPIPERNFNVDPAASPAEDAGPTLPRLTEVHLGDRVFVLGVVKHAPDQWSERRADGYHYAHAKAWLDRIAQLEATLATARNLVMQERQDHATTRCELEAEHTARLAAEQERDALREAAEQASALLASMSGGYRPVDLSLANQLEHVRAVLIDALHATAQEVPGA